VRPRVLRHGSGRRRGIQAHLKGDLRGVHTLLAGLDRHQQKKAAGERGGDRGPVH